MTGALAWQVTQSLNKNLFWFSRGSSHGVCPGSPSRVCVRVSLHHYLPFCVSYSLLICRLISASIITATNMPSYLIISATRQIWHLTEQDQMIRESGVASTSHAQRMLRQ